jgi:hypothetical protein
MSKVKKSPEEKFTPPDWALARKEKIGKLPFVYANGLDKAVAEIAGVLSTSCSVKMDIAFIAAEMLLHIGRGQMAAQLGQTFSETNPVHLNTLMTGANIFEQPAHPNQESTAEALFLGFVKSVVNNDPFLKKQRWKTAGNSDLPFIAALSFLVGNIAESSKTGTKMSRADVKAAFEKVKAAHCPTGGSTAGGGPFCDWLFL